MNKLLISGLAAVLSFNCFAEGFGDLVYPEKYDIPKIKDFKEWSESKNAKSEAIIIFSGSVRCGSKKGLKKIYNYSRMSSYLTSTKLRKNNCTSFKRAAIGRIIKTDGLFSFVEFSFTDTGKDIYNNVSYLNWITDTQITKYNDYLATLTD